MESAPAEHATSPARRARLITGAITLLGVLGAGLLGGYVAGSQGSTSAAASHGEHAEPEGEDHAAPAGMTARTLANLGVEVGEVTLGEHVDTIEVPAVAERPPLAERSVVSPVAGVLRTVLAQPGTVVEAGAPLAEVLRDAFPAPVLTLTAPILQPLSEAHHEAAVAVRRAALALELARAERERLSGGATSPDATPGRVLREADYAVRRAVLELESAAYEAERHGMTAEQVAGLSAGTVAVDVPDVPDVRRVLVRNRLWSPEADALLAVLPEGDRARPYTLAVLGELVGSGRLPAALVEAVRAEPRLAARFLEAAGLVQQGATAVALAALAAAGGLEPVAVLRAPKDAAPDYDVSSLALREGQRVEAGTEVLRLVDERRMLLRLAPAQRDLAALLRALAEPGELTAEPLVAGGGARLSGLKLLRLVGTAEGGAAAEAAVPNLPLALASEPGAQARRTWAVRPGSTWRVGVPVARYTGRFVLPAGAIAYRGAEAVVLVADGDAFRPVPVRLEHHDAGVAVVAADGAIFPGSRIVLRGAPVLGMALLAGPGAADPHAGHNH